MKSAFKIVALLVMTAVGTSAVQAQLFTVQPRLAESPGGCHGHGKKIPTPSPTSYECCLTGHDVAVPQSAHSAEAIHFTRSPLVAKVPAAIVTAGNRYSISAPAAGPPGGIQLRI